MKFISEKTQYFKYALESEYDPRLVSYCRFLKDSLGWREFNWDSEAKKWRFNDLDILLMFRNKVKNMEIPSGIELDRETSIDVMEHTSNKLKDLERIENAKRIKDSTVSSIEVRNIKGNLYEYQKIGVEFFINSGGRALLADSPGVGKTAQSLAYIAHTGHNRTLIVCPASVKFSWENEIAKWTYLKSYVVYPDTQLVDIPHDVNCVIINFDILKKFFNEFMKYKWDAMIVDESHLIKSQSATRSKVVKSLSTKIPNVLLLTGTPVLSRPIELFNILNIIDPKTWNNYYSYAVKYCEGHRGYYGFEAKGAQNLEELNEKISKYFLRRTKEEVLKELPPKNRIDIVIELPEEERKQYNLVEENLVKYLKSYKTSKTDKEIAKSLQAEKLVKLNLLREINTMGKLATAKELINNIIEAGEKVLIFSSFNGPLTELYEEYEDNAVLLLGSTPIDERGVLVKKFQEDPDTKIFFGGMKSAGVGITLTAASNVIFLDLPWNPADFDQAENRAHRPSAEYECLNIYKIISKDSVDVFMNKVLSKKQAIIDLVIDGEIHEEDEKSVIDDYIKQLELKHK